MKSNNEFCLQRYLLTVHVDVGGGGMRWGLYQLFERSQTILWNLNFVDLLLNIERHRTCCVAKQYFNIIFYFLFVLCCITFLDLVGKICWPYFKHVQFWSNFVIYILKVKLMGPVTKIKNIRTDATKILRPTHFSGSKDIKTDRFFVGLNLWLFFSNPISRS